MEYQYGENINYEDYASGRVLYHQSGVPNFPVRLANEIFGRCFSYSKQKENLSLYDCCCGGGYLLTTLALLNSQKIKVLFGSDISEEALRIARLNTSLLTTEGLNRRIQELSELYYRYQKPSHQEALISARRFEYELAEKNNITAGISSSLFHADALKEIPLKESPNLIITDVPYGNLVSWEGTQSGVRQLLNTLLPICNEDTILGICMDKKEKAAHPDFERLEKQIIGKRRFEILKIKDYYTLNTRQSRAISFD